MTLDYNAVLTSLEERHDGTAKGGSQKLLHCRAGFWQGRDLCPDPPDGEELDLHGFFRRKRGRESRCARLHAIGSGEGSIPLRTEDGGTDFVRDTGGKPVQSRLDDKWGLREIAETGGGFYEPLGPDGARKIFEKGILVLDEAKTGIMTSRQPIERINGR